MKRVLAVLFGFLALLALAPADAALAAGSCMPGQPATYTKSELIEAGHRFFGSVAQGLASIVERAVSSYGLPNGYILGQEGGGAFFGGLRYGEGTLSTKNAGQCEVFWQGPSIGADVGGNGDRVMMLVYNLPDVNSVYQRFYGISGSAYVVAGLGMTVMSRSGPNGEIYVAPIVAGVGARFGVNLSYLKFTDHPTWNPF